MNTEVVERWLQKLKQEKEGDLPGGHVTVYLVNGIKLQGNYLAHDDVVMEVTIEEPGRSSRGQHLSMLVFRSAISTIKPE